MIASVALLILHPHPDIVPFPVRSAPETWPVLCGGHLRAEWAEGSYNGWLNTLFGPPSHQQEPRVEQPTATMLCVIFRRTQGHIREGLVLFLCWFFLEVCVMLEGQVMPCGNCPN